MMSDVKLPNGWAIATVGDLADYVNGRAFKPTEWRDAGKPIIRIQNLNNEAAKYNFSPEQHEEKYLVKNGDLLFAWSASLGAHIWHGGDTWLNQHIFNVLPRSCTTKQFIYYLLSKITAELYAKAHGSGMVHVTKGKFESTEIALPPLNEQHRIVAKIEELFSELDKGIESLKTAREQIKVYRQALLKHAFEGKLTAQWRAENRDQLETDDAMQKRIQHERAQRYQQQLAEWQAAGKPGSKPKAPKSLPPLTTEELAELPELPEGWAWARLLEACEAVVDCHNKTAPYQATGVPLVRTPSIRDMKLNFDDSIRYVSEETYAYWSRRCPPLSGDILFTREAPMGEAALIPEGKMVCMGQRIMLLRPGKFQSGRYLLCATQNPIFKKIADKVAVGTGVKHLRVGDVERLVFPLCSIGEQNEIANQLEASLSEVDQLELTITSSLQQAEALRQSILKKAFSGQLVAQDPADESASVLLARIQAEKAAQAVAAKLPKSRKTASTKTNVIPFPARIPGIPTAELHAGIMALAYQRHEQSRKSWYFGHVKAEKISHMVESHLGIDLERKPIKDAAGPNDFQRLLAVEAMAREQNWFDVQKQPTGRHMLYKMDGFDGLIEKTSAALGERLDGVNALIELFIPLDKTRSEIVATLYAAWNNLLLLGRKASDEEIVLEATENWHGDKLKIRRERFFNCLTWMRNHGLVPAGMGSFVAKKGNGKVVTE